MWKDKAEKQEREKEDRGSGPRSGVDFHCEKSRRRVNCQSEEVSVLLMRKSREAGIKPGQEHYLQEQILNIWH